jgi:hypothetical protein
MPFAQAGGFFCHMRRARSAIAARERPAVWKGRQGSTMKNRLTIMIFTEFEELPEFKDENASRIPVIRYRGYKAQR